jgi:hypothetical protein
MGRGVKGEGNWFKPQALVVLSRGQVPGLVLSARRKPKKKKISPNAE